MALMDHIQNAIEKVVPPKSQSKVPVSMSASGALAGARRGTASFEDEMIVSKPAIVFHASQAFFNFLAMCCFASVASFQAKWGVGPSGLTGFAIFISIAGIILSLFMLLVPVIYEKYDKLNRLARALKEVRVGFILAGAGTSVSLLIAFIVTISAWTQPGCKDPNNDPNAKKGGDAFKNGLSGWCSTKKAGAIFFWLAFAFWLATLTLAILDWRHGKTVLRPRDPPFTAPPVVHDEEEGSYNDEDREEASYGQLPPIHTGSLGLDNSNAPDSPFADTARPASSRFSTPSGGGYNSPTNPAVAAATAAAHGRPSIDAYGAFSDPPPSGFAAPSVVSGGGVIGAATSPAGMSRTMQYADPYAAVRASIGGTSASSATGSPVRNGGTSPLSAPPGYEYTGYK